MSAWRGGRLLTRFQSDVSMVSSLQEDSSWRLAAARQWRQLAGLLLTKKKALGNQIDKSQPSGATFSEFLKDAMNW